MTTLTVHDVRGLRPGDRIAAVAGRPVRAERSVSLVEVDAGSVLLHHPEPNPHGVEWRLYAEQVSGGVTVDRDEVLAVVAEASTGPQEPLGLSPSLDAAPRHLERSHLFQNMQAGRVTNHASLTSFQRSVLRVLSDTTWMTAVDVVERLGSRADVRGTAFSLNVLVEKGYVEWGPGVTRTGRPSNAKSARLTWRLKGRRS